MIRITPQTGFLSQVLRVGKTVLSLQAGKVVMAMVQVVGSVVSSNVLYDDASAVFYDDATNVVYVP
jgi:hypothetical protein